MFLFVLNYSYLKKKKVFYCKYTCIAMSLQIKYKFVNLNVTVIEKKKKFYFNLKNLTIHVLSSTLYYWYFKE